jgi:hypothetical protein
MSWAWLSFSGGIISPLSSKAERQVEMELVIGRAEIILGAIGLGFISNLLPLLHRGLGLRFLFPVDPV